MLFGRSRFAALALALGLAWGCGGSDRSADAPSSKQEGSSSEGGESDDSGEPGDDSGGDSDGEGEERKKAACDDGTCVPCGSALCPNGWYCDESAKGGPACGWLPECAKKPNCACVKRAFSGCSCEDQDGVARLTCG